MFRKIVHCGDAPGEGILWGGGKESAALFLI